MYFFGPVRRLTRELKARTSSRLEQCILKATRPDATPVKQKHLDRILGSVSQFDAIRSYYKCEPSKVRCMAVMVPCLFLRLAVVGTRTSHSFSQLLTK